MVEATLDITFTRDGTGKATRMDYSLIGFPGNIFFGIFLNEVKTDRIRTNVSGQIVGYLDSIPPAYDVALTCISDLHALWGDNNSLPSSGTVFGVRCVIPDDAEDPAREGTWTLELRYD
jgi:hypothetical protein